MGYGCNEPREEKYKGDEIGFRSFMLLDSRTQVFLNFTEDIPTIVWRKFKHDNDLTDQKIRPGSPGKQAGLPSGGRDGEPRTCKKHA